MRDIRRWIAILLLALPACDQLPSDPELPQLANILRHWRFSTYQLDTDSVTEGDWHTQLAGVVSDLEDYGPMALYPPGAGPNAISEVFSSETGSTYWLSTQAPHAVQLAFGETVATFVDLEQSQWFEVTDDDARLEFVISSVLLEAMDFNTNIPNQQECPWLGPDDDPLEDCLRLMQASLSFELTAHGEDLGDGPLCGVDLPGICFFSTGGSVELFGLVGVWDWDFYVPDYVFEPVWGEDSFVFDGDVTGTGGPFGGPHAQLRLREPIVISIPLTGIPVGRVIQIYTTVSGMAANGRQRESYVSAYFRDPAIAEGLGFLYSGMRPVNGSNASPRGDGFGSAPICPAGEAGLGAVEFARDEFTTPERPGYARVIVNRTGSSAGRLSARVEADPGTATPGADFEGASRYVNFADGEAGPRAVEVRVHGDDEEEEDETVSLSLTSAGGCGAIGSRSAATLRIMDDDGPLILPETYTVGGTVTGLVGTGLTLTLNSGHQLTAGNGPFVFNYEFPSGLPYNVAIRSQPTNPVQSCTVANGSGTIDGADVTDVEVSCEAPPSSQGLDPSFGDEGRLTSTLLTTFADMALQPDGKIIVVGRNRIVRFLPDGTLDAAFGANGVATSSRFSTNDRLEAVTIQPDGRIVVAGSTRDGVTSPTQEEWLVARFAADGSIDATFGSGGYTVTDFDGRGDSAHDVFVLPDGRIVATGGASLAPTGISDSDFAAAVFTSAGVLDPSFGGDGLATANVAGRTDIGYAGAVQSDGGILVAGRVAASGGATPDVGIVRFTADGTLDDSFGTGGVVRETTAEWDEAAAIAVQSDGRIVLVGHFAISEAELLVGRYLPDGSPDGSFGSGGRLIGGPLQRGGAVALQDDGGILIAGVAGLDFGLTRLTPAGAVDTSFMDGGLFSADFFGGADTPGALEIEPDGALLVAGDIRDGTQNTLGIIRVVP